MSLAIEVSQLSKSYRINGTKEPKKAVDQVNFTIHEGTCFGLLGPNGAGKSTTMKILTGIIEPDQGNVAIFGHDYKKEKDLIRKQIGYVPQSITLFETISAYHNLLFFGEMMGLKGKKLKERVTEVLEQVGLADRAHEPIKNYSGGMKRRINIAAALLHSPGLIILDEPTVGIDPQSRNHIFDLIRDLKKQGVTILYSTHYMEEVEALCDYVAIIDHGNVIVDGPLDELLNTYGSRSVYVEAKGLEQLPPLSYAKQVIPDEQGWLIETEHSLETLAEVSRYCQVEQLDVKRLEIVHPSLESIFLSLTGTSLRD